MTPHTVWSVCSVVTPCVCLNNDIHVGLNGAFTKIYTATTCLENLEMSGNLIVVKKVSQKTLLQSSIFKFGAMPLFT